MEARASMTRVGCCALGLLLHACRLDDGQAVAPAVSGAFDAAMQDTSPIGSGNPMPDASSPPPPGDAVMPDADAPVVDAGPRCTSLATCTPPEGCTASEYSGHVYFFCAEMMAWDAARARCFEADTDLAIIEDSAENMFVAAGIGSSSWIGLNDRDQEGDYRWVDPTTKSTMGSSSNFTSWGVAKPDNCAGGVFGQQDCVRVLANGTWDDSDCEGGCTEGTFAFVCESI